MSDHIPDVTKMIGETPRTEAAYTASTGAGIYELFQESKDIERELNEANKTIRLQHELMTTAEKRGVDKAKEELNEANEHIKLLKSSGDELLEWLKDGAISDSNYRLLANSWQRAKENKR